MKTLSAEPKSQHLKSDNTVPSQDSGQSCCCCYCVVVAVYVAEARTGAPNQPANLAVTSVPDTYCQLVREELIELDERKKRRCLLAICGLEATSAELHMVEWGPPDS